MNGSEHLSEDRVGLLTLDSALMRNPMGELFAAGDENEHVALGFMIYVGHVTWEPLVNVSREPESRFEILGEEVRALLNKYNCRPIVMWHSHRGSVEPSATDLETFPTWLTKLGAIYHVPSGQTTLYTEDGVISSSIEAAHLPLATTHNTEA